MVGSAILMGVVFGPAQVLISGLDRKTRVVQVDGRTLNNALREFATKH